VCMNAGYGTLKSAGKVSLGRVTYRYLALRIAT
jgi:hypothetical protein